MSSEDYAYELLALVDEGSFAEVFRSKLVRDGTIVAVKRIKMRIVNGAQHGQGAGARLKRVSSHKGFV